MLYINYVSFFHISQKKQLKRVSDRINEFYNEVQSNININRTFSIDDIQIEERLDILYESKDETAKDVTDKKDKKDEKTDKKDNMNSDFKGVTKEQLKNKGQPSSKEPDSSGNFQG
jgi:regulator of replication initiation timing